jgi:hypothetical protein
MRNLVRVLLIDIIAPLAVIGALLMVGLVLDWPVWWVSVASMLGLLVAEAMVVNFMFFRRDAVTVGTDDQRPGVRLMVVAVATVALVAALFTGYLKWFTPDRELAHASAEAVRIAADLTVATTSFTPGAPDAAIEKAASYMAPDRVDALKDQLGKAVADLQKRQVTAQGKVISAGVEAIGPDAASVAVILRGVQSIPGQPPTNSVLSLRVSLVKQDGRWFATDVAPINSR